MAYITTGAEPLKQYHDFEYHLRHDSPLICIVSRNALRTYSECSEPTFQPNIPTSSLTLYSTAHAWLASTL